MHAKAHVIAFPDGTWCSLAGAQLLLVPDIDVLTHSDSFDDLIEHHVVHVVAEWPVGDADGA